MVNIQITITDAQATAFTEAVSFWNEKHGQKLTAKQMVLRLAKEFYRENVGEKRYKANQCDTKKEMDNIWG